MSVVPALRTSDVFLRDRHGIQSLYGPSMLPWSRAQHKKCCGKKMRKKESKEGGKEGPRKEDGEKGGREEK